MRNWVLQASAALGAGTPQKAERLSRCALEIRRQALGAGSKEAAASMCTLADALRELGRCGRLRFTVETFAWKILILSQKVRISWRHYRDSRFMLPVITEETLRRVNYRGYLPLLDIYHNASTHAHTSACGPLGKSCIRKSERPTIAGAREALESSVASI